LALAVIADYACRVLRQVASGGFALPRRWQWFVLPIAVTTLVTAWLHPWPMQLRFATSRAAFERALAAVEGGQHLDCPRWVGWFPVFHVETYTVTHIETGEFSECVCFIVGNSVIDPVVICYDPSRPPSELCHRWITGSWYASEL
jgi:hypothetical protein